MRPTEVVAGLDIREAAAADVAHILAVHRDAFGADEGPVIVDLLCRLLDDATGRPALSLVAEDNGQIAGHVLFTAATINRHEQVAAQIMAPLAVASAMQGRGIGTRLIESGLTILRERGTPIVMVYGDPAYYSRTGFTAQHAIRAPHTLTHPQGWLAQALVDGALTKIEGRLSCADALNEPLYW